MADRVEQIPNSEYFAIQALSNSGMKDLAISPMRYWFRHVNPERQEREETAAMKLGSALHCAVLEGDTVFDSRYAAAIDPSDFPVCLDTIADIRGWITDQGQEPKGTRKDEVIDQALGLMSMLGVSVPILDHEKRIHAAKHDGKTILTPEEWRRVCGMARALTNEPVIQEILSDGRPEVAYVVEDPETGVKLKAKMDWVRPGMTFDLKSFSQSRGKSIDKSVADAIYYEGYHRQACMYDHIRTIAEGGESGFIFGFIESEEPHEARIVQVQDAGNLYWQMAKVEVRALIRLYAECWQKFGDKPWRTEQQVELLEDEDLKGLSYA